jgi:electron transfer flavoprotein alpha subunit
VGPLPALISAAEDLAEERFPSKAERQAAAEKPIATVDVAGLGLAASDVGVDGSPTWVAAIEHVPVTRRGELLTGDDVGALAARLGARLRELGALAGPVVRRPLPAWRPGGGAPIWVVAEIGTRGLRTVTAELLAKAASLAGALDAAVEAVVIGADGARHADAFAAAGADRVLVADAPGLEPYTTEAHAAVLADAIRARRPRLVLLGSTVRGRDLAPRVAARLGLGLTGDAIDVDLDPEGRVRQLKPAFGGAVVAPILSRTRPEMATVRPGMLAAAAPDTSRRAEVVRLPVPEIAARVRVVDAQPLAADVEEALDVATLVLGVGKGLGVAGVAAVRDLADRVGAAICATREVTDLGWLPRQYQVGLTGRAIAPRCYVGLAVSGAMEHLVGLARAGTIVAVNKSPKAPVFKGGCDVGVVADVHALLPHLAFALQA